MNQAVDDNILYEGVSKCLLCDDTITGRSLFGRVEHDGGT